MQQMPDRDAYLGGLLGYSKFFAVESRWRGASPQRLNDLSETLALSRL